MKLKFTFFLLLSILISLSCFGQRDSNLDITIDFQAYPTGLMPGIRFEEVFKDGNAVHLRLGYNWVRHRDLGVHEDERGGGFGLTIGYKRYFTPDLEGFNVGLKTDVWWNTIDWKDGIDTPSSTSGTTKITVVQPTIEAGYLFLFGQDFIFTPTLAFGYEVNVKTNGLDVGDGAILLLGFNLGKRF